MIKYLSLRMDDLRAGRGLGSPPQNDTGNDEFPYKPVVSFKIKPKRGCGPFFVRTFFLVRTKKCFIYNMARAAAGQPSSDCSPCYMRRGRQRDMGFGSSSSALGGGVNGVRRAAQTHTVNMLVFSSPVGEQYQREKHPPHASIINDQ